jgi:hypothetical protein
MEANGKFECQVKLGMIGALLGLAWRNLHAICPSNLCQPRQKVYFALHGVYLGFKKYRRPTLTIFAPFFNRKSNTAVRSPCAILKPICTLLSGCRLSITVRCACIGTEYNVKGIVSVPSARQLKDATFGGSSTLGFFSGYGTGVKLFLQTRRFLA